MNAPAELAGRLDRRAAFDHAHREGLIHAGEAALGGLLVEYADARGVLRGLGYQELGELLGRSRRTVARALGRLSELGLVRRLQAGRGWRRAAYAVVENSTRGDFGLLRALSRCSHARLHPEDTPLSSPLAPLPLRLSPRAPWDPEGLFLALERRRALPSRLERERRRELVHLAAAYARRQGRLQRGANLLGWILARLPARILARSWCRPCDHTEARRTLTQADRRALRGPPLHASSPPGRPGPAAAGAQPGPAGGFLEPGELDALAELNRRHLGGGGLLGEPPGSGPAQVAGSGHVDPATPGDRRGNRRAGGALRSHGARGADP